MAQPLLLGRSRRNSENRRRRYKIRCDPRGLVHVLFALVGFARRTVADESRTTPETLIDAALARLNSRDAIRTPTPLRATG